MIKKILSILTLISLIIIVTSCNGDKQRAEQYAYESATMTNFLLKNETKHIVIEVNKDGIDYFYDENDYIYDYLISIDSHEVMNRNDLEGTHTTEYFLGNNELTMFFYTNESIVGIYNHKKIALVGGSAFRYYRLDENDFNTLVDKIEEVIDSYTND